jgi:hypothetical protein
MVNLEKWMEEKTYSIGGTKRGDTIKFTNSSYNIIAQNTSVAKSQ